MSGGFDVSGRRVLITGSSSGLGAAMAIGLAERGAIVGLCARRADRLDEVLAQVRRSSPSSRAWVADLADLGAVDGLAAQVVDDMGGVDVLVNNAGIPKRRWTWEHRPDEVTDVLRINLESPIRLTLALLPNLATNAGRVVFVGSVAARLSPPAESVYAASKAGVTAFAESLRVDLGVADSPVRVHLIQPGVLETELFELPDNDRSLADIVPEPPSAIVEPLIAALRSDRFETFVPSWFADVPVLKANDVAAFLDGSTDYTRQRLEATGRERPSL